MGSKVLLVLLMFMATVLLISSEAAPNEYGNFDKKDGKHGAKGIDESKWGYGGWGNPWYGGGWGGPWRGGGYWGGPWRGGGWGGPWGGGYGGWRRNEHVEVGIDANPHN